MDINNQKVDILLEKIETMKRNKIKNHEFVKQLHYVDPNGYINKLDSHVDHVIFGRRGSGKTTLMQKSINRHKENDACILLDCEIEKTKKTTDIVIDMLKLIVLEIKNEIDHEELRKLKIKYNFQCKWITRIVFFKNEERKNFEKDYKNINYIFELSKKLDIYLNQLSNMNDEISMDIEYSSKQTSIASKKIKMDINAEAEAVMNAGIKDTLYKLDSTIKFKSSISANSSYEDEKQIKASADFKEKKIIKKIDMLDLLKEVIIDYIDSYHKQYLKKIILFLDDFYYINKSVQPYILNFLHQINKNSYNNSFSFKLSALPNRFKMNYDNEFDLSIKDDFSSINLDKDLSDMQGIKSFLLDISSSLVESKITPNEVEKMFVKKEVLNLAIVACGGNPRDFLVLLEKLIRHGRKNDKLRIGKTMIYSVVYDSIQEKENSIEEDEVMSKEKILEAVGLLRQEIISKNNTNVFLYPYELYEKHALLIKSLIAFGYLHQIKETIVSDYHGKKTFVPFSVDMSLYVTESSMKRDFDYREFWVKDEKSRLTKITSAPEWSFPESF